MPPRKLVAVPQELSHKLSEPERLNGIEDLDPNEVFTALARSETYALTYALLATNKGPYSKRDTQQLFINAQGREPVWTDIGIAAIFYMAEAKLQDAGLTKIFKEWRQRSPQHKPQEVQVTDIKTDIKATEKCLAETGALLVFSLGEDSLRLSSVFGVGRESAKHIGETAARRKLLEKLSDGEELSEAELGDHLKIPRSEVGRYLGSMIKEDIVVKGSAEDWDKRIFKIKQGPLHKQGKPLETVWPERQAVYKAIQHLQGSGESEVSAEALYGLTVKLQPDVNRKRLGLVIAGALKTDRRGQPDQKTKATKELPLLESAGAFNKGDKTKFTIHPDIAEKLDHLLATLSKIEQGDPEVISEYAAWTRLIVNDSESFNLLINKVRLNSAQKHQISDEKLLANIGEVLAVKGPLPVAELAVELWDRDIRLNPKSVEMAARRLQKAGRLAIERAKRHERMIKTHMIIAAVIQESHAEAGVDS